MIMQVNLSLQKGDLNEVLDRLGELIGEISTPNYRVDNAKHLISSIRDGEEIIEKKTPFLTEKDKSNLWYLHETIKNRIFPEDRKSSI